MSCLRWDSNPRLLTYKASNCMYMYTCTVDRTHKCILSMYIVYVRVTFFFFNCPYDHFFYRVYIPELILYVQSKTPTTINETYSIYIYIEVVYFLSSHPSHSLSLYFSHTHTHTHTHIHTNTHTHTHTHTDKFTHSLIDSPTHSLTHSPPTNSLTHTHTHTHTHL